MGMMEAWAEAESLWILSEISGTVARRMGWSSLPGVIMSAVNHSASGSVKGACVS